jgi:hypothetical protein
MFEHLYDLDLYIDDFCCLITISILTALVGENIRQYSLIGPIQQNMKLFKEDVLDLGLPTNHIRMNNADTSADYPNRKRVSAHE